MGDILKRDEWLMASGDYVLCGDEDTMIRMLLEFDPFQ